MTADCVCVAGYGRVGSTTAWVLSRLGYTVYVYDASAEASERAARGGLATVSSPSECPCRVAAVAVPSSSAHGVVESFARVARVIVDVSYVEDPSRYMDLVLRYGVTICADAGLAPGLSNVFAARLYRVMGGLDELYVYVGGILSKPAGVLGLAATWSVSDLLEEYTRPARARVHGREVLLDPLDNAVVVGLEGVGVFEALPTDGLRSLLHSLPDVKTMVEYTVRYLGHTRIARALRDLGLLSSRPLQSIGVSPRALVASVLETVLPRHGDRVVLYVVGYRAGTARSISIDYSGEEAPVPALTLLTGLVHAWFVVKAFDGVWRGLVYPEQAGFSEELYSDIVEWLRRYGVSVVEQTARGP